MTVQVFYLKTKRKKEIESLFVKCCLLSCLFPFVVTFKY